MIKQNSKQNGSILVSILIVLIFMTSLVYSLTVYSTSNLYRSRSRIFVLQAQYAAESAADQAIALLNSGNESYTGTTTDVTLLTVNNLYKSTYSITVSAGSNAKEKIITAEGKVYAPANNPTPNYKRKIEVTAQRSSTNFTTGISSRNILYIQSGVKNVIARDIYANGFIYMNKNTTNLVAENITVADKYTSAGNCSIAGTGNLVKPTSFETPAQTKTNLILAYNNCINPPGNASNSDFNVQANQANISKISSTYIPWSQYMDSSYQNSPGGCNDWTSGSFPRDIPSTGNTKKTHYPDTGSGVSLSCGLLGDVALGTGQYNIKDNVHIRGNLCLVFACSPTFYNPDSSMKYVFVEGSANFATLTSAPGSGPIAFIVYGTDPLVNGLLSCPYGDAIHLANGPLLGSGTTNAPAIYLMAMNGICIDKTKFSASPALGGISGKNIYIASNPGTPFDLKLDPEFPVNQLPIDLSWKAIRYRRI